MTKKIESLTDEQISRFPEFVKRWTVPPGVYGVTYQRQYAEELRRVLD